MKSIFRKALITLFVAGNIIPVFAQFPSMQYFRTNDLNGMNVFETPKVEGSKYEGLKLRIGGGFTQQFQALSHENTAPAKYIVLNGTKYNQNLPYPITSGFNTASANLLFDVQLEDGVRLNLTTYLSARRHNETWVKGGYIQIDKMKFLKNDLIDKVFDYVTLKVGHQEINYGDAHFRRSDGGNTIFNPFIENYIIDAFATEIGGEVYFQSNGFLAMIGMTNGEIKGNIDPVSTAKNADSTLTYSDDSRSMSLLWKVGYDNKLNEDVRVRLTASGYMKGKNGANTLFSGDRTGSNYFLVMESAAANAIATPNSPKPIATTQFTSGRFNPNMNDEVNTEDILEHTIVDTWKDNIPSVKEKYKRRIERFHSIMNSEEPVLALFIGHVGDVELFKNVFKIRYNKTNVYYAVLSEESISLEQQQDLLENHNISLCEPEEILIDENANMAIDKNAQAKLWFDAINKIHLKN